MGDSRVRSLLEKALVYVGSSRPFEDLRVFTNDRERLLSEHAPVLKEHNNPMAHTAKEVESIAAEAGESRSYSCGLSGSALALVLLGGSAACCDRSMCSQECTVKWDGFTRRLKIAR